MLDDKAILAEWDSWQYEPQNLAVIGTPDGTENQEWLREAMRLAFVGGMAAGMGRVAGADKGDLAALEKFQVEHRPDPDGSRRTFTRD